MMTRHRFMVGLAVCILLTMATGCGSRGTGTASSTPAPAGRMTPAPVCTATPAPAPAGRMTPAPVCTATPAPAPTDARRVKPSETCELRLPGNPTTGYSWEVVSIDEKVARLVKTQYVAENTEGTPVVGGGGVFVFRFQGVAVGKTTVKLVYHRPWEKDVAPLLTHDLDIMVQ